MLHPQPVNTKPPLLNPLLRMFMITMVLANISGNMYGPFQITAGITLLTIIPIWFKFKLPANGNALHSQSGDSLERT